MFSYRFCQQRKNQYLFGAKPKQAASVAADGVHRHKGMMLASPIVEQPPPAQDLQIRDLRPKESGNLRPFREQRRLEHQTAE